MRVDGKLVNALGRVGEIVGQGGKKVAQAGQKLVSKADVVEIGGVVKTGKTEKSLLAKLRERFDALVNPEGMSEKEYKSLFRKFCDSIKGVGKKARKRYEAEFAGNLPKEARAAKQAAEDAKRVAREERKAAKKAAKAARTPEEQAARAQKKAEKKAAKKAARAERSGRLIDRLEESGRRLTEGEGVSREEFVDTFNGLKKFSKKAEKKFARIYRKTFQRDLGSDLAADDAIGIADRKAKEITKKAQRKIKKADKLGEAEGISNDAAE